LDEMPDSVLSGKPIESIADDPAARKWTRGQRAKPSGASDALTPRQRARAPLACNNTVKPLRIRFPKAARPARIGGFVAPCLAASTAAPPAGASFVHEVKFDGYRLQAILE
jgi:bifunctional non-homologous end joining protein LigD